MNALARLQTRELKLDRRWFAAFLGLQAATLIAFLLMPHRLFFLALGGIGSTIFLFFLLLYPWIIVPAIVATTALDITGKLVETTALGIPVTGFHLSLGLMLIAILANAMWRCRTEFPKGQHTTEGAGQL